MILTPTSEFLDFSWLEEGSTSSPSSNSSSGHPPNKTPGHKVFRPRRSHTKSRNGCLNCKSRHVKCDETRPHCNQCRRHDVSCQYTQAKCIPDAKKPQAISSKSEDSEVEANPWVSVKMTSMGNTLTADHMARTLYPQRSEFSSVNTGLVHALRHFESIACNTLGSPASQRVMQKQALSLSRETPFLLHAIFAYSARHLQLLQPNEPRHQLEATYHRKRAFKLYSQHSRNPRSGPQIDALLTGYMILSALAFHQEHPEDAIHSSFLRDREGGSEWLNIVQFLRELITFSRIHSHIPDSVWLPALTASDDGAPSFTNMRPGLVGLDPLFVSLCNITPLSDFGNNPYHHALHMLGPMLSIEANIENFSKLISFPCRVHPQFLELYREKDPAALLIMACWFGQMLGIEHWWCQMRARTECWAICNYLDGWPDARVQALLECPKKKCGYVGIDVDAIQTCVFGM